METDILTSGIFVENKYVILTSDKGDIIIYNIPSREIIFRCNGHNGEKIVSSTNVISIILLSPP